MPKNIDDLVEITEGEFADLDIMKLNDVFLSYHLAMESAVMVGGGNINKLQHSGKAMLRREAAFPLLSGAVMNLWRLPMHTCMETLSVWS